MNDKDKYGNTPLHIASQCGHTEIMQMLLTHEANLFETNEKDKTAVEVSKTNDVLMAFSLHLCYFYWHDLKNINFGGRSFSPKISNISINRKKENLPNKQTNKTIKLILIEF